MSRYSRGVLVQRLSVVIANHNDDRYVAAAIESALALTTTSTSVEST